MALTPQEVQELNRILDARDIQNPQKKARARLRLIVPPTPTLLDPIFRDAHIKRIIHLRDAYRLRWLVDQATFNVASLSCLEDCDLIRLLTDMERARECIADGISFEDAGLVRSVSEYSPAPSKVSRAMKQQAEVAEMSPLRLPRRQEPDNPLFDLVPF